MLFATEFVFTWKEAVATSIAFVIIGGVTLYRFVIRPKLKGQTEPPRD